MEADQKADEQSPEQATSAILKVAHKGLIRGMMGSFGKYGPFGWNQYHSLDI